MTNSFVFNDPEEIGKSIGDSIGNCLVKICSNTRTIWKNYIFPSLVVIKDTIKPFFDNPELKDFENDFVNSVMNTRKKD